MKRWKKKLSIEMINIKENEPFAKNVLNEFNDQVKFELKCLYCKTTYCETKTELQKIKKNT